MTRKGARHQLVEVGLPCDVALQELRVGAERAGRVRRVLARRVDVSQHEPRTLPRQRDGRRPPDPGRDAGHEHHLAVDTS